jgi:hypothetical protein
MSYKRVKTIEAATFVQGTVNCTYDTLCRYFGEPDIPQFSQHEKIQGEWLLYFTYGNLFVRISDWKQSKLFLGEELGKELLEITPSDFRDVCDIGEVVKNMSPKQTKNFFENWFNIGYVQNYNRI